MKCSKILGSSHSKQLVARSYSFGNNSAATSLSSQEADKSAAKVTTKQAIASANPWWGKCHAIGTAACKNKKSFLALRERVGWEIRKLKMDKVNWQEFSRGREKSTNTKQWHHRTALALHLLQDCSQFSAIAVKASIWFWISHSTHKGTFQ